MTEAIASFAAAGLGIPGRTDHLRRDADVCRIARWRSGSVWRLFVVAKCPKERQAGAVSDSRGRGIPTLGSAVTFTT